MLVETIEIRKGYVAINAMPWEPLINSIADLENAINFYVSHQPDVYISVSGEISNPWLEPLYQ